MPLTQLGISDCLLSGPRCVGVPSACAFVGRLSIFDHSSGICPGTEAVGVGKDSAGKVVVRVHEVVVLDRGTQKVRHINAALSYPE